MDKRHIAFGKLSFYIGAFLLLILVISFAGNSYAGDTSYTYDTLGRVIKVVYPNGSSEEYSYDKAGNRIVVVRKP